MTDGQASMVRHIVTSILSGIVVALITGAIGYYGFINRIDERLERAETDITRMDGAVAEMQRERADLKATMNGVQIELRNLNRNFERLEQRLIRQEDRSWKGDGR